MDRSVCGLGRFKHQARSKHPAVEHQGISAKFRFEPTLAGQDAAFGKNMALAYLPHP
jgi:hypothetical protein